MRFVLLNPPVPGGAFTNRDLMGGMGIDDGFGVGLGPRFLALLKYEGIRLPVLALAYGAALLREHDVTVLDLARRDPSEAGVLEQVVAAKPDWVIAASSFAYLGSELRFLQQIHERTGAKRLLFGSAATYFAQELIERDLVEAVANGDPEVAIGELAKGTIRPGAPGVLMRGALGRMVPVPEAFLDDLDALPIPDWSRFPVSDYGYYPLLKKRPFLTVLSSRGCPYGCSFCPYPVGQGDRFRARAPERVVDELQQLVERHGVRSVLFRDPTFSLDLSRVKEIARGVKARKLPLEWGIETRLDRLDEELITLLGDAGCRSIEVGIDPLDEQVRRASHRKGIAPERARDLLQKLENAGIATAGLFVVGLPEQAEDEVRRTLDWIDTLPLSYMNYEVATPFPGTPLYRQAVERGWTQPITLQQLLDGDPKLSFNGAIDLGRMKSLQDEALRRFYLRPRKVAMELLNRDVVENVRFMAACGWKFVRTGLRA